MSASFLGDTSDRFRLPTRFICADASAILRNSPLGTRWHELKAVDWKAVAHAVLKGDPQGVAKILGPFKAAILLDIAELYIESASHLGDELFKWACSNGPEAARSQWTRDDPAWWEWLGPKIDWQYVAVHIIDEWIRNWRYDVKERGEYFGILDPKASGW